MRRGPLQLLGSAGTSALRRLTPAGRLQLGALGFAAALVAPVWTPAGAGLLFVLVVGWLLLCRLPAPTLRGVGLFGGALFLPYLLLLPLHPDAPTMGGGSWSTALAAVGPLVLHGLAGLLVTAATLASVTLPELHDGLAALPLPGMVTAILLQILHQTGTLLDETRRVADALTVRGAAGAGWGRWRLLAAFPGVWLPRLLDRAERQAAALELRGLCQGPPVAARLPASGGERGALAAGAGLLAAAVLLRLWASR